MVCAGVSTACVGIANALVNIIFKAIRKIEFKKVCSY
ncbi:MAG: hypothetical protein ACLRSQ_08570 [Coprobacillus cateniformis]